MDRGAWWATVHGVTENQTWLMRLSTHTWRVSSKNCQGVGCVHWVNGTLEGDKETKKFLKSELKDTHILWPNNPAPHNLSYRNNGINMQRYWLEKSYCIIIFNCKKNGNIIDILNCTKKCLSLVTQATLKNSTINWTVYKQSEVDFSQPWRLGISRSGYLQIWCRVRFLFPLHWNLSFCMCHMAKGVREPSRVPCKRYQPQTCLCLKYFLLLCLRIIMITWSEYSWLILISQPYFEYCLSPSVFHCYF